MDQVDLIFKTNEYLQVEHEVYNENVVIKFPLLKNMKVIRSNEQLKNLKNDVQVHLNWFKTNDILNEGNYQKLRNLTITCTSSIPDFVKEKLHYPYGKVNEIFTSIMILGFHVDDFLDDESSEERKKKLPSIMAEDPQVFIMMLDFMESLFLGEYDGVKDLPENILQFSGDGEYRKIVESIQLRMEELKEIMPNYRNIFEIYLREFIKMIQASCTLVAERVKPSVPPSLYKKLNYYPGGGFAYFEYSIQLVNTEYGISDEVRNHVYLHLFKQTVGEIYRMINDLIGLGLDVDENNISQNLVLHTWKTSGTEQSLQEVIDKEMIALRGLLEEIHILGEKLMERFEDSMEIESIVKAGKYNLGAILGSYFYTNRYRNRQNNCGKVTRIDYVVNDEFIESSSI